MIRSLAAVLTLAAGWSFTDLSLDRLRWNGRERTASGIEILETENKPRAIDAFETAARLDASDPTLRFNAGSAHLAAESEGAIGHLQSAAETASGELRAAANYNLGNAHLRAGDAAGAIAAFEEALRVAPNHQDAKFNLELALRQQEQQEQQQQQQDQQQQEQNDSEQENQQQQSPGDEQEQEQSPGQDQQGQQEPDAGKGNQPLPHFEEQPDMSAEQAATILEAVENLEREERRRQAEQEMKKRSRKGKDW